MLEIKENFDITPLTTFKIGGPVRYFCEVDDEAKLKEVFLKVKDSQLPFVVIGAASNILFNSTGYKGWVIKINFGKVKQEGNTFEIGAGIHLSELINKAKSAGLGQIHKLIGIPGTLGGAVKSNTGAYGVQLADFIKEVKVLNTETMKIQVYLKVQCAFEYRKSLFTNNQNLIIVSAKLKFDKVTKEEIEADLAKILAKRKEKPYATFSSAGSIFKNVQVEEIENPHLRRSIILDFLRDSSAKPGIVDSAKIREVKWIPAGYVIEEVGLKGQKVGQAQISQNHGNVIVNLGKATFNDVVILISMTKTRVRDELGVPLKEEIVYVM